MFILNASFVNEAMWYGISSYMFFWEAWHQVFDISTHLLVKEGQLQPDI